MRLLLAALTGAAALALAAASQAYVRSGPGVMPHSHHRLLVPGGVPPLDGLTTPSGAYGLRKLKSTYAGSALRLRRASDNAELDIGFVGFVAGLGSPLDVAAANAHCNATTCFVRTWYDQSGAARDLGQATAANQPQVIFNCQGFLPCLQFTALTVRLDSVASITSVGTGSFNAVANRTVGTGQCFLVSENGATPNWLLMQNPASWTVGSAAANLLRSAPQAVWHTAVGVLNGASSVMGIDGGEAAGTATGNVNAGVTSMVGAASTTCNVAEMVFWDGYLLSAGERSVLVANQRGYWGF